MTDELESRKRHGVIVLLVVIVSAAFFVGISLGGDLIGTYGNNDEEPLNGEMKIDSLHVARSTIQETLDPETGENETQEMMQEVWIRESVDMELDVNIEISQDGELMLSQIFNSEEERMYIMQTNPITGEASWLYDRLTFENLKSQPGFTEMIGEFEDIAMEYEEGDQFVEEDPETGESREWEIQIIETNVDIEDDKFTPPEDAEPEPIP